MSKPFNPNDVVGWGPSYGGLPNGRQMFFYNLKPEIQLALQEGRAYKERWERLRAYLNQEGEPYEPVERILRKMSDLESQPANEGE